MVILHSSQIGADKFDSETTLFCVGSINSILNQIVLANLKNLEIEGLLTRGSLTIFRALTL